MGLLTTRGDEDDEDGTNLNLAGLDHLDGGDGDDEVTYELDEWSEADLRVLRDRLETLGVPHQWEGTTLVASAADEAWVERILDQVDDDLSSEGDDRADEDDDTQVAYDLRDWDDESCLVLLDALSAETIPYAVDADEVFVAAADEARVDEIIAALTTPGATLRLGGPVSFEAMSALFVAADQLAGDPDHRDGAASLVAGARTATTATAPYGMAAGWWDGVVARAGALADLLETVDPDPELVVELATGLRDDLRPVV